MPRGSPCELAPVRSTEDWQAYHDIRRRVLFEARGRFGVYDPDHPDEVREGNHPLLLRCDGEAVATVRIDQRNAAQAIIRLVAVRDDLHGRGHGRRLIEHAEHFIRELGCREVLVNAALEAEDFYRWLGFERQVWDPVDAKRGCVQMTKSPR